MFGESSDSLPYIGRLPGSASVSAALGFGGNGITFADIAARRIADELDGVDGPGADLFHLAR